jgi:prepilin-type N-terminal cleavage/methylation domain-containing protein
MEIHAKSSKGFSLIEMMVALVVIAFTLLALSGAMVSSVTVSMENELRNAAVRLTNKTAEVLLALPIESTNTCGITPEPGVPNYNASYSYDDTNTCLGVVADEYKKYPNPIQSTKGFQQKFNIVWTVSPLNNNLKQITIAVAYKHSNGNHINNAVIYKHRTL